MSMADVIYDRDRPDRIGMPEAILCEGKSPEQIAAAIDQALQGADNVLLTRLVPAIAEELSISDYDEESWTGIAGTWEPPAGEPRVAVVAAGTSDLRVAREALRTLAYHGIPAAEYADVGVAGLWRLLDISEELAEYRAIIAVAGMDGAMFTVLSGLVPGVVVAVPTSIGYGVSRDGETALHAALASCAQGIVAVNIDNGYGAACAVTRLFGLDR
ncbi:MAG: nickel pincer cofactor biosynthesis protein LarB [bacterium]|nr:nickel pincer cofactor biosynthesis protein LarB [bacterium]MCP4966974.1 nickel pincer cofactor biosynthesis protein LarB [bacterium]